MTQNQLSSKVYQISASVKAIKNTPKAVVAFRATCAKNFPYGYENFPYGYEKIEDPGEKSPINKCFGSKDFTANQAKCI